MLDHPNIKEVKFSHEGQIAGDWNIVLIIETDLPLNPQDTLFVHERLVEIIEQVKYYVANFNRQIDDFRIISHTGEDFKKVHEGVVPITKRGKSG